ncbi:uroporphyrinogen-III synthase [Hoeflea sp.]|uniref:uroporphyrinogen-III synthase n=1 Tax=Hoeflea sp. TaxID=1940281 RepID=UPI003B02D723
MRVLVTRPEPGAARTAGKLRDRGADPVLMPLTRTVMLTPERADFEADRSGAFAVTSANAIRSWRSFGIESDCLALPVYAVGARTGAAASEAGFHDVRIGAGDGTELAGMIVKDRQAGTLALSADKPLVYAAGRLRQGDFERALKEHKLPMRTVEIYETENISYSTDYISGLILDHRPDVVLLYSSVAAERFFESFNASVDLNLLKDCNFFCISEQVAKQVPVEFSDRTLIAASPDEENLMRLFDEDRDSS